MTQLTKEAKLYLEGFSQMPKLHELNAEQVRSIFAQAPPIEVELPTIGKVEDKQIPVEEGNINIRIYTPEGEGPFPIIVYYHGGGWVIGDIAMTDDLCHLLCKQTNHIIVSVEYRLAPEYKFPTPVDDAYAGLTWVSKNARAINGMPNKISVSGDSAGGNLSAVMALKSRDENGPAIHSQILIYPVTELTYDSPSYEQFKEGFGLDRDLMIWFGDYYINQDTDKDNPYVSPLRADNLSQLPPALVLTAEADVLRDEGIAYAERLKEAGVVVTEVHEEALIHGYFTNVGIFKERIIKSIDKIDSFLKNILVSNQ